MLSSGISGCVGGFNVPDTAALELRGLMDCSCLVVHVIFPGFVGVFFGWISDHRLMVVTFVFVCMGFFFVACFCFCLFTGFPRP